MRCNRINVRNSIECRRERGPLEHKMSASHLVLRILKKSVSMTVDDKTAAVRMLKSMVQRRSLQGY